ncbi:glycosyltransferase family 2 protein [Flavobacterium nackdongense]|uniref:Glycosyltransferase family 2 protein n=1 Tax=Flavobacterium nackdongense TaxID=2547394 RepID=A0A4P6YC84_9FLAO|nr:glycosyltransferase family 2 protein [Flavobacterium nackdongense]QBN19858.1 glycosyltransferase family 2 protein [Flavobacterium nackdongense]
MPMISIIVPCYNQAHYLDEALQSVLGQTYPDWECIIVNDGSPDRTAEVAQKWVEKDSRFVYIYKENGGVSSARNLGIEKAKGVYLQFLDADDFLVKDKLALSLQQIEKNSDVNLVITNFRMFTDNPEMSSEPYCALNAQMFSFENMLYQWNNGFTIPIHCGFFHSSLFESIRFPEDIAAQEDWVVWVRIFKKGCTVVFIDQALALYRINPSSRMTTKGLSEDHLKACAYFRNYLSTEEYIDFSTVLFSRYYQLYEDYKYRLSATKNSNSYQTGLMVKKVLKSLGVLGLFKRIIPLVLQFKAK